MKVSVALCTYNGAQFIAAQLKSLQQQTRLPDEVVICDDVSTDDTLKIIEDFTGNAKFPVRLSVPGASLPKTLCRKKILLQQLARREQVFKDIGTAASTLGGAAHTAGNNTNYRDDAVNH